MIVRGSKAQAALPTLVLALVGLPGCIPNVAPPPSASTPTTQPPRYPNVPQAAGAEVTALPAAPPAWESHPVTPDAQFAAGRSYIVQPGDSLRRIAQKTGIGALAIAASNGIPEPYVIRAGQTLMLPGGRYHTIARGQTGIAIARAYGVEWSRIVAANGLAEPYILRSGWRLLIPDDRPGVTSAAERAAAFTLDIDDLVTGSEPALAENKAPARASPSPTRVPAATTALATPARLTGGFSWPAHGPIVERFGPGASGRRNDGIQIGVPVGTPIAAAADGVVAYVGDAIPALGGLVIVKHGDGYTTVYGNANELLVKRGQSVKRGQTIAKSGDSGSVKQPGVHFEIRKGRDPVDPLGSLPS